MVARNSETPACIMARVEMRLSTYNILKGGHRREGEIVEVIRAADPDVAVVQEVQRADGFRRIAAALGMAPRLAEVRGRVLMRLAWSATLTE